MLANAAYKSRSSTSRAAGIALGRCWLALAALDAGTPAQGQSSFVNFEGKQTSPVRLSPSGNRLFAVNTPDARLSVFDVSNALNPILVAEIPVGLEPVSVNPRTEDEAWVVNEVSDSLSVVSVTQHVVTDTIYVPDEPADVVFANGRAFVTASRKNQIVVIDPVSHTILTNIPVFGENPRALTVNSNGTRVYAAFALSGNRTTLVPPDKAPAQPLPTNPNLPAPPQVSLIVDAADPAWAPSVIKYTMPDNDVVELDTATLAITRYFTRAGTVNLGIAVRPGTGDLYLANTDARNLTPFEPNLRGAFVTNQISRINGTNGAVTRFDLNPGFNPTNFPSRSDQTNALAQPAAIVFGPSGNNCFVAAFGSDRVALVDANTGNVTARIELCPTAPGSAADPRRKRGPRGLALKPGGALYVLNRISNTLTVIDPSTRTVVREIPVGSHDPTPEVIRQGRGFLYDAKLSGNGTVSCASCHVDAEMDLIAWDLGDPGGSLVTNQTIIPQLGRTNRSVFHPMKGPMTTQTLRGLRNLDPLHWRGDRTNFLHFNGAFDSLLGGSVLSSNDLQAYRDFIHTIEFQPNPNQNLDRTLPTSFAGGNPRAGLTNFTVDQYVTGLSCNTCHALPTGTARFIVPASALQESQDFKIPHLRNIYQKLNLTHAPGAPSVGGFGLVHDGEDPDLVTFLSRPVFQRFSTNGVIQSNLNAFMLCFDTGTAPAVGYARTLTAANVDHSSRSNDWTLLESQAAVLTNIHLVVRGTIDGRRRGLLYQPVSRTYLPDTTNLTALTRAQLRGKVLAGDTLTVLGVPPGAGPRLGLDRDLDGVRDGDEPHPPLRVTRSGDRLLIAWPTHAADYVLESASHLPTATWTTETSLRGIVESHFTVTNALPGSNTFFRLRQL